MGLEIGQGTVDKCLILLLFRRQRLLHEVPDPMPDHLHVLFPRMPRQPAQAQGIIHRLAEVIQRIQQRPVQVEEYQFKAHTLCLFGRRQALVQEGEDGLWPHVQVPGNEGVLLPGAREVDDNRLREIEPGELK